MCFRGGDAQRRANSYGIEFRVAELGSEFGLVPHREFHRRPIEQGLGKVSYPGRAYSGL